jgi:hypothetical protein
MEKKLFIHVGLHKTGTTFLQKQIFPNIPNVNYYGPYMNGILIPNFVLNVKVPENKTTIISCEGLSGHPGFSFNECSREEIADRLHSLYPHSKIIIVTRKKERWVDSLYKQYIKMGGTMKYEDWRNENLSDEFFHIDEYIEYLKTLFDDVLVMDFQLLKSDPDVFIQELCKYMNVQVPEYKLIKENISLNKRQTKFICYINNLQLIPEPIKKAIKICIRLI